MKSEMTRQIGRLMADAVAGQVKVRTRAKLLAPRELDPVEADEVSLALAQAQDCWKRLWDLIGRHTANA
jgi:hypothetical protein